ncbi:MAG: pyroglutamyl-peptidase I [Bdellovibrionales bacterium]
MKVLISGFEPFGGDKINPSQELIKKLKDQTFAFEVLGVVLPVSFENSFTVLKKHIDQFKPDYVVCTGLAKDRSGITIERIAVNVMEASIPDNDGYKPHGERIISNDSDGLFSTLPIDSILTQLKKAEIKSSISNTAGTYVCNSLMYKVLSYGKELGYRGGFIHLPPIPGMVEGDDVMGLNQITKSMVEIFKVLEKDFDF